MSRAPEALLGVVLLATVLLGVGQAGTAVAEPSVFSVTDPARGLYGMHPALLAKWGTP